MERNYIDIKDFIKEPDIPPFIQFEEVREFKYYRRLDCEDWAYHYYIDLVLADISQKYTILIHMKRLDGRYIFRSDSQIIGFAIESLAGTGYETAQYHIFDFEDRNIDIYCDDIEISLIDYEE